MKRITRITSFIITGIMLISLCVSYPQVIRAYADAKSTMNERSLSSAVSGIEYVIYYVFRNEDSTSLSPKIDLKEERYKRGPENAVISASEEALAYDISGEVSGSVIQFPFGRYYYYSGYASEEENGANVDGMALTSAGKTLYLYYDRCFKLTVETSGGNADVTPLDSNDENRIVGTDSNGCSYYQKNARVKIDLSWDGLADASDIKQKRLSASGEITVNGRKIFPVTALPSDNAGTKSIRINKANGLDYATGRDEHIAYISFGSEDMRVIADLIWEDNINPWVDHKPVISNNFAPLGATTNKGGYILHAGKENELTVNAEEAIRFGVVWYTGDEAYNNTWVCPSGFGNTPVGSIFLQLGQVLSKSEGNGYYDYISTHEDNLSLALRTFRGRTLTSVELSETLTVNGVSKTAENCIIESIKDYIGYVNSEYSEELISFGENVSFNCEALYYYLRNDNGCDFISYSCILTGISSAQKDLKIISIPYVGIVKNWEHGNRPVDYLDSIYDEIIYTYQAPAKAYSVNSLMSRIGMTPELVKDSTNIEDMKNNTINLQNCVDTVHENGGGTVLLPAGKYYFANDWANGAGGTRLTDTGEEYICKPKDNVLISGAGNDESDPLRCTVLCPVGTSNHGIDMFYFNEYADYNSESEHADYLVNADFKGFVIDGALANAVTYNSAGKGFMFNLFRDCDFKNVTVKNTVGTGFGIDCPINSTIIDCIAINCGRGARSDARFIDETAGSVEKRRKAPGASGFGIGTGYDPDNKESMLIANCQSYDNFKYGFFFEHQQRFKRTNIKYYSLSFECLLVTGCKAACNFSDFGAEQAFDIQYRYCEYDDTYSASSPNGYADTSYSRRIWFDAHSRRCFARDMDIKALPTNAGYDSVPAWEKKVLLWGINKGIISLTDSGEISSLDSASVPNCSEKRTAAIIYKYSFPMNGNDYNWTNQDYSTSWNDSIAWATYVTGTEPSNSSCTVDKCIEFMWRYMGSPSLANYNNSVFEWAAQVGVGGTGASEGDKKIYVARAVAFVNNYWKRIDYKN